MENPIFTFATPSIISKVLQYAPEIQQAFR